MSNGEQRCPSCNRRLFDTEHLVINPEGSLTVKCKCKQMVKLTTCGLTLIGDNT